MNARTAKFVFILLALGLTVLLFSWPNEDRLSLSTNMDVSEQAEDISTATVTDMASTIMEEPNFTGEDDKNRHWGIKAKRAVQSRQDEVEVMKLEQIEAFSTAANGGSIRFKAREGVFIAKEQSISLNDDVEVSAYGYILTTKHLHGNMQTQALESDTGVKIEGIKGTVTAGYFSMQSLDGKVVLSKGVKMRLYPRRSINNIKEAE